MLVDRAAETRACPCNRHSARRADSGTSVALREIVHHQNVGDAMRIQLMHQIAADKSRAAGHDQHASVRPPVFTLNRCRSAPGHRLLHLVDARSRTGISSSTMQVSSSQPAHSGPW